MASVTLRFYGSLREYGSRFDVHADTAREALHLIISQIEGIKSRFIDKHFQLRVAKSDVNQSELEYYALKEHVIVTTFNGSADHMMLYLGNEEVLHHLYNRNSRVEFLHDYYRKKISYVLRHKDWKNGMIEAVLNDLKAVQYG